MQVYIDPTLINEGIGLFLWNETLILFKGQEAKRRCPPV